MHGNFDLASREPCNARLPGLAVYQNLQSSGAALPHPIFLADGDKGGTGKSFTARLLAHVLTTAGLAPFVVDGDGRNPTSAKFLKELDTVQFRLRNHETWSAAINWIGEQPLDRPGLIDLPAGAGDMLGVEAEQLKQAMERVGRPIVKMFVMDEEDDSIVQLRASLNNLPVDCTLAVFNGRYARSFADFELWRSKHNFRTSFLEAGGRETFLPALSVRPRTLIRNAQCSFTQAQSACQDFEASKKLGFGLGDIVAFESWLSSATKALAPIEYWR